MLSQFDVLLDKGFYKEVWEVLEQFDPGDDRIQLHYLKTKYLLHKYDFDIALQVASRALFEYIDHLDERWYLMLIQQYHDCISSKGELQTGLDGLYQLEPLLPEDDKPLQFENKRMIISLLTMQGHFGSAKSELDQLEILAEELGRYKYRSQYYMQKARIYDFQGSLLPAIENYQQAIEHGKKSEILLHYLDPLHNISNIYQYQGKYRKAVAGYIEEIEYLRNMGFEYFVALTQNDLAWSYFLQGRDEEAINLFFKAFEFIDGYTKSANLPFKGELLTRMIIVGSYTGMDMDYDGYYKELVEIADQTSSPQVQVYVKVAKATRYLQSKIFSKMAEAIEIFHDIIDDDKIYDIEFSTYAYLSLFNIHFQNYGFVQNEEIIDSIKDLNERFYTFAVDQESPSIKLQADWIRAKMHLIEGDRDKAMELLTKVLRESDSLGFDHIATQAGVEIDHIDDDLIDVIDQSDFAYFRHDLTRQMLFSGQIQGRELPILFFIMGKSGLTIYSQHFDTNLAINENLISSFVTAVQSFGPEAIDAPEPLNQIQYRQYKVLIEKKPNVSLVFVIKGQTYPAQKKLLDFSRRLDSNKYRKFFKPNLSFLTREQKEKINELFSSIFVYE